MKLKLFLLIIGLTALNISNASAKCVKVGDDYDYETTITNIAKSHSFDPDILYRLVYSLSNFNNCANGGLLRLRANVANSYCKIKSSELYDVNKNLNCGLKIIKGRTRLYFNGNMVYGVLSLKYGVKNTKKFTRKTLYKDKFFGAIFKQVSI